MKKINIKVKELLLKSISFFPQELQKRLIVLSRNMYFLILLNVIFAFMFVVVVNLSFVDTHLVYLEEYQDPYVMTNFMFVVLYIFVELVFIGYFYLSLIKIGMYIYTFFNIRPYPHDVLLNIYEAIGNLLDPVGNVLFPWNNFAFIIILIVLYELWTILPTKRLWTIFTLIRIASVIVFFKYL